MEIGDRLELVKGKNCWGCFFKPNCKKIPGFLCGDNAVFKILPKQGLKEELNIIIDKYVEEFEEKHETALEFWVADDKTGIACFGDHFFNLSDIVYDIDNECEPRTIFGWQNYQIESGSKVNFQSYLAGAR